MREDVRYFEGSVENHEENEKKIRKMRKVKILMRKVKIIMRKIKKIVRKIKKIMRRMREIIRKRTTVMRKIVYGEYFPYEKNQGLNRVLEVFLPRKMRKTKYDENETCV